MKDQLYVLFGVSKAMIILTLQAQAYSGNIRGYLGEVSGVVRAGVHFVPFYTKTRLADILKTYYTEINIYR